MKRIKVLGSVLKRTRADKIIIGFIVFIFAIAAVIQLVEPDIIGIVDTMKDLIVHFIGA